MIGDRKETMKQLYRRGTEPCPRCIRLAFADRMPIECVQPLPPAGEAPLAVEDNRRCCFDCASTDTALKLLTRNDTKKRQHLGRIRFKAGPHERTADLGLDWDMLRIAVANDRSEQYRLPGVPMGLVLEGWVRPSYPGELADAYAWLRRVDLINHREAF